MSNREAWVEVRRGGIVESRHRFSAVVVEASGRLLSWVGDPTFVTYFRSAAKPFQAVPIVEDGVADALELDDRELAICSASHSGEPRHVEVVRSLLGRIGCSEDDLECGAHAPFHAPSADALTARGEEHGRLHNNCSGKHAGMLAWARHHGEPTANYRTADHAVQRRIRREIARWCGIPQEDLQSAVDGCGVVTFALPLDRMAYAFASLASETDRDREGSAARIVHAMTREPYYVAGSQRLCTDLMRATHRTVLAKGGAEGVFCAADLERSCGIALKIEDGGKRAVGPAALQFLAQVGIIDREVLGELDEHRAVSLTNTRGEIVGEIRAEFKIRKEA